MTRPPLSPVPACSSSTRPSALGLGGGYGAEAVYLVDLRESTPLPLDVPMGPVGSFYSATGDRTSTSSWFVDPDCRVGWATDGFPDGWLQPGRMALVERNDDRLFLHARLDFGSTWQRIPVSDEDAIPDALQRLG